MSTAEAVQTVSAHEFQDANADELRSLLELLNNGLISPMEYADSVRSTWNRHFNVEG